MAENSKIEWTDHTFNPWIGCTKVSPACKNCYAERDMDHRYGMVDWGPGGTRVLTGSENWAKPVRWDREAKEKGVRHRVFCASLADVFEDWQGPIVDNAGKKLGVHGRCGTSPVSISIPSGSESCGKCGSWFNALTMNDVRQKLFALIDATPNLDWLLLTKRPENVLGKCMWPIHPSGRYQEGMSFAESHRRSNVWLGTSVENQEYADKRIPELLKCRDLSPVLFLSCEPLLGPVMLDRIPLEGFNLPHLDVLRKGWHSDGPFGFVGSHNAPSIDWVIAGGESGPKARPTRPDWFRSLRDQCQTAGVPFLFKQWGEFGEHLEQRVGKVRAGRSLDGVIHDGFPAPFQQR
jgi:protein gp37